jgi:cytochrome c oxidase assembly protein subunit 15
VLVLIVLFIQLLFGAYTAGLNAGHASDTWPLMNGSLLPVGIDWSTGLWSTKLWAQINNDPYLIHYIHRWWAWVAVIFLVILARKIRKVSRRASIAIHTAFGTQVVLGIATVMTNVDIVMAVLHQAVGALVVAATVWGVHILGEKRTEY